MSPLEVSKRSGGDALDASLGCRSTPPMVNRIAREVGSFECASQARFGSRLASQHCWPNSRLGSLAVVWTPHAVDREKIALS